MATFAIGTAGAANAALFAVAMLASDDAALRAQLDAFRARQTEAARAMTRRARHVTPPIAARRRHGARRSRRRHARRDGRRPARPHVRARGAAHGLLHGGARPRPDQPGRPGRAPTTSQPTTSTSDGPGAAGAALRGDHHRVRERAGGGAGHAGGARGRWRRRAEAVAICQDRAREKAHFVRCGVPCAPYARDRDRGSDLGACADALLPGILKTARLGYDGKGQVRRGHARRAGRRLGRAASACPACSRSGCRWRRELSVIVARGADGAMVHLPVQQNLHRDGILAVTAGAGADVAAGRWQQQADRRRREPIAAGDGLRRRAVRRVLRAATTARWWPTRWRRGRTTRGHYSIDACDVSQFELQVRTLAGLPLVAPRLHSPAVMLNLLGDLWFDATATAERTPRLGRGAGAARRAPAPVRQGRARGAAARWAT